MNQLGFDSLLATADQQNRDRAWERKAGHLPTDIEAGVELYRTMIEQHHQAMMQGNVEDVMTLRDQVRTLAKRLNDGEGGFLAPGAPGRVLEDRTKAKDGVIPSWGQTGSFIIDVQGMRVRIELGGMFCLTGSVSFWPGFAAHIVDHDKPFFSETGYRSFLGLGAQAAPGLTPDAFTAKVIEQCIAEQQPRLRKPRVRS